ncbi:AraC family transcriptional regulator [uncultured Draconibacterium sp.]|uniref:AraC family transcriptional regulator n=1 Tax=uncultured Draconibacterium sp. TaxID=1573823 RepID=UPI003261258F
MNIQKRQDGFTGQRMVYIPDHVEKQILQDPRIRDLYITHIGHFPNAKGQYRDRPTGSEQYILFYCKSGQGRISVEGNETLVKSNNVFIIPPNKMCRYSSSETQPWDNYWIHFTGKNADLYTPPCEVLLPIEETINSRIEDRMLIFEQMLQNLEQYNNFENVLYANTCLKYYLTSIRQIENFRFTGDKPAGDYFSKALSFMNNNTNKRITLSELGEICGCSSANLYKVFMKKLKCSPMDYFLQMKIQKACRYLVNSEKRIKEIAQELGYDDQYYFSRLFSKHIRMSPSQFRNNEKS